MNYVTRKNIPLPPVGSARRSPLTLAIAELKAGEMFEIPDTEMAYAKAYGKIKSVSQALGHKVAVRKLSNSIGVWMLERGKRVRETA